MGNYQKVDWNEPEVALKIGEGRTSVVDTYHSYELRIALQFFETRLGVKTW